MPIYEYRCEQGHTFEVMQRMTDDPVVSCQTCDAPVERVFHPVAVHFKGKGFYNTDYGTRKRSRELRRPQMGRLRQEGRKWVSSSSKSESSSSSDSKSDSKPAEAKASSSSSKSSD